MKQYILLTLNTLTLILTLIVNFLSGSGAIGGKTIGEVSAQNETLVTPAGYAFSIWGIIYLLLIAYVSYQWYDWIRHKSDHELKKANVWFMLSNVFNSSWIYFWLNGYLGLSVIVMFMLLVSLIILTIRLRLETWDAPVRIIFFVWWPICIYLGWIIAASVANTAIYLKSIPWEGFGIPENIWAVVMIIIAALIYIFLIFTRNLREAAGVGIWAFVAIAVKQKGTYPEVVVTAVIMSVILFLLIAYHGYKNQNTSPFKKIARGEI
ncbi:MAG: hypothetical protein P8100_07980 [bacterium]|jgi:hypothetical protein